MWSDIPRQIVRRFRKSIRLPASSDVALLSSLTAQLRERASLHLSHPVNAGLIAYPALTGLYEEAVNDAADHVHLRALTGYFSRQPRNIFAPYAGYGLGLCERGVNYSQCRDELLALPAREVLLAEPNAHRRLCSSTRRQYETPSILAFPMCRLWLTLLGEKARRSSRRDCKGRCWRCWRQSIVFWTGR